MSREEFIYFIKSIGFKVDVIYHCYNKYKLCLYHNRYALYNGSGWCYYEFNDLTPFKVFKKELRSIKLKNLLG